MKNGYLFGMAAVAVVATTVGWLLADKRVVLIVASDSSEITVNRPAATEPPSPVELDPIPLQTARAAAAPAPAVAPAAPEREEAKPDAPAPPDEKIESAEAESAELPAEPRTVAAAPTAPTAEKEASAGEGSPASFGEAAAALAAEREAARAAVSREGGIGRLGHVALTALPTTKKRGKQKRARAPDTFYPMGRLEFDEAKLTQVMKRTDDEVRRCYQSGGARRAGKVMAELTLTPDGDVRAAAVSDSTVHDPVVERCVQDLVKGLVFPKGTTSKPARVTYYWELRPNGV